MQKTTTKMKMARRMLTSKEIKKGVTPFMGMAWKKRSGAIQKREALRAKVNQ